MNFVGRRIKAEKYIDQALSRLQSKSKKRKYKDDEVMNDGDGRETELIVPLVSVQLNDLNSNKFHLLADLRGLSSIDEKTANYYACALFCTGGDNSCQKFSKIYNKKNREHSLSSDNSEAKNSNSTTVMDFERY